MQQSSLFKNSVYVLAALAGAGLIIYGAFFYTQKSDTLNQNAQVLPQSETNQNENSQESINFDEPYLGEADAPVTLIEYGSYLCGHCIDFAKETFPKINEDYVKTGKVKFIYRSYPPFELGMAALCANDQNKFWEYHAYAINNQLTAEEDLKKFARNIGLDADRFNKCLDNKNYDSQSQAWYAAGQSDGIEGTPTFMINGKKVVGALSYEQFKAAIDEALQK